MTATRSTSGEVREFLAGGTDLMERRRSGVSSRVAVPLAGSVDMRRIDWRGDGGAAIGAQVTIDALAHDQRLRIGYPGLAAAAAELATPEIRRMATVGGNIGQRTRCWYYRNHATTCLKKGGDVCPARNGNHFYGVVFDRGPCVAPHPSTLGAALMAYDAVAETSERRLRIDEVFGDGSDGTRDHLLQDGEVIQRIAMPPPVTGERAWYHRAVAREHAEWPLVEIVARLVVRDGIVDTAALALGGVAPVPLRLPHVEAMLAGAKIDALPVDAAAQAAHTGARPLRMTGYKIALIEGLVADALGRLAAGG